VAATPGADLLNAARKGDTGRVKALIEHGYKLEAADRDGRTALMLAAQHGHADIVRLLLAKGARSDARDRQGFTAYGLAVLSPSEGTIDTMQALPHSGPLRLAVQGVFSPENLTTSCFFTRPQLVEHAAGMRLEALAVDALREFAAHSGKGAAGLVPSGTPDADAAVTLRVRPSCACVQQQSSDEITLSIDLRVTRRGEEGAVLEKTLGGGLKGLHARSVTGPAQHAAEFEQLTRSHASGIYWAVVGALLQARK